MNKKILLAVVFSLVTVVGQGSGGDEKVVRSYHETIVGRDASYVPEAARPKEAIITVSAATVDTAGKDRIAAICKSVDRVKSAVYDDKEGAITLSIDARGSSAETVTEKVKSVLVRELDVAIIEARVIN
ncbi:MAG: hypothetical protein WC592_00215 [Candidatus Omnitrophota bacterium]|nr:hypothetical protein [Candidatus Omnitrophota bacterium]